MSEHGTASLLAQMFREHHRELVRYAYLRTGDRQLAEDLAAECFAIACRHSDTAIATRGWLIQTTRNLIGDVYRRRERDERLIQAIGASLSAASPRGDEDPYGPAAEALTVLPERDREVLTLLHLEDLTTDEVAEALAISVPAVWQRSRRARDRLRTALDTAELSTR